jgi:hypothetical protein
MPRVQQVLHGKISTLRGGFISVIVAFVRKQQREKGRKGLTLCHTIIQSRPS